MQLNLGVGQRRQSSLVFMHRRSWLRALALTGLTACTRPAEPAAVPGTYVMNRGAAADTLVVQPGGRYWRRYVAPSGVAALDTGRWAYDVFPGDAPRVSFSRFPVRWQAETFPADTTWRAGPAGWWPPRVRRTLTGRVVLPVAPDIGWAYERIGDARPRP